MTDPHTGSCLCGAVTFEIHGAFRRFFLCHCSRCRKGTGSAHAANLFAPGATIDWRSGHDTITEFVLPDSRHARSFCAICGGAVPGERAGGKLLVVPAGCLDTPVDLRPEAHIFCADRANWDDHLEQVPCLDGPPA